MGDALFFVLFADGLLSACLHFEVRQGAFEDVLEFIAGHLRSDFELSECRFV